MFNKHTMKKENGGVMNPKTLSLEELVRILEPDLLSYYLEQVSSFLQNNKKDLWFPQISQELDAFLVKIIRDEKNLRDLLGVLDEKSKRYAENILATLKHNENVYKLIHSYDNSQLTKETLIYRKILTYKVRPDSPFLPANRIPSRLKPRSNALNSEVIAPNNKGTAPNSKDTAPNSKGTAPNSNGTAPNSKDTPPNSKGTAPNSKDIAPNSKGTAPNSKDTAPNSKHTAPNSKHTAPNSKDTAPNSKGTAPNSKGTAPNSKGTAPDGKGTGPNSKGTASNSKGTAPNSKGTAPNSKGTAPKKRCYGPSPCFNPNWVRGMLRFVREDHLGRLEFSDMSLEDAELVASCLDSPNEDCDVLRPLYEALKVSKQTNEYNVTFQYLEDKKVRLIMQKVLLEKKKKKKEKRDHSSESDTKRNPSLAKMKQLVQSVEPHFIRIVLEMILDFINNESEVTLTFKNANDDQCAFLQSACAMAKCNTVHDLFEEESQCLLRKIEKMLNGDQKYEMKSELTKMEPDTNLRSVSITKQPKEYRHWDTKERRVPPIADPAPEQNAQQSTSASANSQPATKKRTTDKAKQNSETIDKNKVSTKTRSVRNGYILPTTPDATVIENTKAIDSAKRVPNPTPIDYVKAIDQARTITKSHLQAKETVNQDHTKDRQVKHYAKVEKATGKYQDGAAAIDNEGHVLPERRDESRVATELSDGRPLPARKVKLLEAMSVPVESDKAMRMMRQMGWEGGPLGARGEGITEPIMPAIHMAAGAGLGHVKPKKEPPKNFRLDILNYILRLVKDEPLKTTVFYPKQVSKKERAFLLNAVTAFTKRTILILKDEKLQELVRQITLLMKEETQLQISAVLHEDKRSITLSKNDVQQRPRPASPPRPPLPPPEAVLVALARHARSTHVSCDVAAHVGQALGAHSRKAAKGLGHRLVLLGKMLELMRCARHDMTLTFEYSLTLKQVHFIKEILAGINLRTKLSYGIYENFLVNEIVQISSEDYLIAEFGNTHRSLYIKKKSIHKRLPHYSKELADIIQNNNNRIEMANNNKSELGKVEIINNKLEGDKDGLDKNKTSTKNVKETVDECEKETKDTGEGAKVECDSKVVGNDDGDCDGVIVISSDSDLTDNEVSKVAEQVTEAENVVVGDNVDSSLDFVEEENVVKDTKVQAVLVDENDGVVLKTDEDVNASKMSDSNVSVNVVKNTKTQIPKYVCIAPDSYPIEEVDTQMIYAFQNLVCDKVEASNEKQLIECLGLKNGAVIYGCHNENGIDLIASVASEMNLKTTNITNLYKVKKKYKVRARINSYLDISLKKLFDKLEEYNDGLKTDMWTVTDVQKNKDNIEMVIDIDGNTFDYISQNAFGLFAGMDKMKFSVVWE